MWSRIALIVIASMFYAAPGIACSCASGGLNRCTPITSDLTVLATVVSREVTEAPAAPNLSAGSASAFRPAIYLPGGIVLPRSTVKVTLRVSEKFSGAAAVGNAGDSVVVQTDLSECGYPFETGHEYLVFAARFQGHLEVNICSATRPAKVSVSTLQQLRAVRDNSPLPALFGFAVTEGMYGQQTWEQAEPVAGLTITASSERGEYHTQTADDGSYSFPGLPQGRYQLSAQTPSGRVASWGGGGGDQIPTNVFPGNSCPQDLEIFNDGRLSGAVFDADGKPRSGSVFALYIGPEKNRGTLATGKLLEGKFEISRLRPGIYRIWFFSDEKAPAASQQIYYPGTTAVDGATPIEIGVGTHAEGLRFNIF